MNLFRVQLVRFTFEALDPLRFPAGKAANSIRGALGLALPPDAYRHLFRSRRTKAESADKGADPPRPFVLRAAHLDNRALQQGESFHIDLHLFDTGNWLLPYLTQAFSKFAEEGIGPGRGRCELVDVYTDFLAIDLAAKALDATAPATQALIIEFQTPTELKHNGTLVDRPEFHVLFARVHERLCTLSELYGCKPLEPAPHLLDFSRSVTLTRCHLTHESRLRRSSRTGDVHPLGGFTGEVTYHLATGDLAPFVPWLEAGYWTGVGRQTVWGKGVIHLRPEPSS